MSSESSWTSSSDSDSSSSLRHPPQPSKKKSKKNPQREQRNIENNDLPPLHTGNYSVEYAKTGRAKCQVCGEVIAHKTLRVGIEQNEKGWGIITRWQHLKCTRLPASVRAEANDDPSRIQGRDSLTEQDKNAVDEMLASNDVPPVLRDEIDVDKEVAESAASWKKQREPPDTLIAPMLPYQKEGLAWLCAQEEGPLRGGILADEMGMGKTLQTIALLLSNRDWPSSKTCGKGMQTAELESAALAAEKLPRGGTLVVVPVIALIQWRAEIAKWTVPGSLTVSTYHGTSREPLASTLAKFDVVLTTYSTLEYEYRAAMAISKVQCQYCGRFFKGNQKLAFHNRYFCGPDAKRSSAQSKTQKRSQRKKVGGLAKMMLGDSSNLLLDRDDSDDDDDDDDSDSDWEESEEDVSKELRKGKSSIDLNSMKGSKKTIGKAKTAPKKSKASTKPTSNAGDVNHNVEMVDLSDASDSDDGGKQPARNDKSTLSMRAMKAKERDDNRAKVVANSLLHRINWHRIVLDEAHAIKDRRCSTAQAVFALYAQCRWCLTGTPLQNRVGELYSLVQFMRMDPYAYYFCKAAGCDCKCLEYKFDAGYRYCEYCGHTPLQHYSLFNREVVNPIRKFGYIGAGRKAFVTLKRDVLDKALLRRTKAGRAKEMVLPPKLITLEANFLDEREFDFYQAIYTQSVAQFGAYVEAGTLLNNYAHIFDLLTRLRQAVDHPYLVLHSKRGIEGGPAIPTPNSSGGGICNLCMDEAVDPISSACDHIFCRSCCEDLVYSAAPDAALVCPVCRVSLTVDLSQKSMSSTTGRSGGILRRLDLKNFQSSTKMEALMEELHEMTEKDPAAKAIVFSQFVSFLDLLEHRIQLAGIKVVKLNGGMSVAQRDAVLNSFKDDFNTRVILISLKAGGVALNLTVASHIYLMDPWWNPAAEYQAIDRAHRLGQHKPIRAVRFVVRNTVEERILRLQEKKRLVFEGTVGGDVGSLSQLSEDDLNFLFQN